MKMARAAVLMAPQKMEVREFPLPEIGDDDALLRLEVCGMCGTDLDYFFGDKRPGPGQPKDFQYPFIPGHEPVGVIEKIGSKASARWGVRVGDRVSAQYYTCGQCKNCTSGRQESCQDPPAGLGKASTNLAPSLWGGYAEYMYIPPLANVFKFSKPVPARTAALFNSMSGGYAWAVERPGLKPGQTIAIIGPGQRGLGSVVAAREFGASFIAVIGRGRNPYKLDMARTLGADLVVNLEQEDPVAAVMKATGTGVDVAVDLTPAPENIDVAMRMAKRGGIVVEVGLKRGQAIKEWCPDILVSKNLTVMGAFGQSARAKREGIKIVESGKYPIEQLVTHAFPLEQAAEALRTLAGEFPERKAMNVILIPPQ